MSGKRRSSLGRTELAYSQQQNSSNSNSSHSGYRNATGSRESMAYVGSQPHGQQPHGMAKDIDLSSPYYYHAEVPTKRHYRTPDALAADRTMQRLFQAQAEFDPTSACPPDESPFSDIHGACNICCQSALVQQCGFCEQASCATCMTTCASCCDLFCSFCLITNYDGRRERYFCVKCEESR